MPSGAAPRPESLAPKWATGERTPAARRRKRAAAEVGDSGGEGVHFPLIGGVAVGQRGAARGQVGLMHRQAGHFGNQVFGQQGGLRFAGA